MLAEGPRRPPPLQTFSNKKWIRRVTDRTDNLVPVYVVDIDAIHRKPVKRSIYDKGMVKTSITLPVEEHDRLTDLGGGNFSKGLRIAMGMKK